MDERFILENTVGNLYWKDREGRYLGCNKAFSDMIGLKSTSDIIGKTDNDLFLKQMGEEKITALMSSDHEIMTLGIEKTFIEEGINAEGKQAFYATKKIPLRDHQGNILGLMGTSLDITKEKQAEKTRSDFISNMQHDLKTPFAGISAIASLLFEMETDLEKKMLLEDLLKSCKQWEKVHHQIIAVLSIKEPMAIKKERVSVSRELNEIREEFAATLRIKALNFFGDTLPEKMDWIETDKMKFDSVLSNLIGNAIKFTEKGSVRVRVTDESPNCKIDVIDTGIGIPADKLDYIFEQFTKLLNSNKHSNFNGVGLGLYASRQIANLLGGDIIVKSKLGEGSTFTFILPFTSRNEL